MIYLNQLPTAFRQSFTASGERTHNNGGFLEGKFFVVYTLNAILVYTSALLFLSTLSLISCFVERRVERAASPSPHTTTYYSMPYSYSYYPYSNLLWGRKKRSAVAEPHHGSYGYSYGYGSPYYGYGYYGYGRKKRSAEPSPHYGGYSYGSRYPGYYWG